MITACSEFNWTRLFSKSVSSAEFNVRRLTTTLPSAFTFTTTSPTGALFSFAADAFGTLTSSSFSFRAAFQVRRKKIRSNNRTSTSGASWIPGWCNWAWPRRFMRRALNFVFDQHRRARLNSLVILQRQQRQHVRGGGFKLGNKLLRLAAEKSVENHRWNTNGKSGTGVHQRLADSLGQQDLARSAEIRAQRAE